MRSQRESNVEGSAAGRTGRPGWLSAPSVAQAAAQWAAAGGPLTPQQAAALQGSAGNAALVQRLARDREEQGPKAHQHGDGCGHAPVVQRKSTVLDVLNTPGVPFGGPLKTEMEGRFQRKFSHLRLHTDARAQDSAAEIGAEAYTSGSHMVFTPAALRNKHTVAHEIAHTIDQENGSVPGTPQGDGTRMSAPGDVGERSAEATADEVMSRPVGPSPSGPGQADHASAQGPAGGRNGSAAATGAVQRTVKIVLADGNATDMRTRAQKDGAPTDADGLLAFLLQQVAGEGTLSSDETAALRRHQDTVKDQLHKWVSGVPGTRGPKSHPDFGSKQQDRTYAGYSDLARALVGWVEAKDNRHREKELAQEVKNNSDVELHLESLLLRVRKWVDEQQKNAPADESGRWNDVQQQLDTGLTPGQGHDGLHEFGHYQKYYDRVIQTKVDIPEPVRQRLRTAINGGMGKVLNQPTRFTFRDKIIVLHDLMEFFGPRKPWNAETAGNGTVPDEDGMNLTTTEIDADGKRTGTTEDRGQMAFRVPGNRVRHIPSTRAEYADSTKLARRHHLPVWAGSSFTAMRMLGLTKAVGGTISELSAVAWGTFAFWRLDYDHTSDLAYHPLQEVMDIAQNYGVPYNMLDPEKDLDRHRKGSAKRDLVAGMGALDRELTAAEQDVADLIAQLETSADQGTPEAAAAIGQVLEEIRRYHRDIQAMHARVRGFLGEVRALDEASGPDARSTLLTQLREYPSMTHELGRLHDGILALRAQVLLHLVEPETAVPDPAPEAGPSRHDDDRVIGADMEPVMVKRRPKKGRKKHP
ncbi:DUF4157 domain-containing protein [Streptomyces sp. NPDC051000]|uniref:eCIS core domain-containing protein n=1 Tax=Streptomyces sp. NPDC051000 TaxID=3155520 RepID=UPI0033F2E4B9